MNSAGRKLAAAVLTALASLAILVTLLAHYADHVLVNPAGFSNRAVQVARTGAVESLIVTQVTDRLLATVGAGSSVRPTVQAAVRAAMSDRRITAEIRRAAGLLRSELVSGNASALTLTLPDAGSAIASSIEPISPQLAAAVTRIGTVTVLDVPIPAAAASAGQATAQAGRDAPLLLILTVALILLALLVSPRRRTTLLALGLGALASGLLAVAFCLAGRGLIVGQFSTPDARTAVRAAWNVYLSSLESSGLLLAGLGAVITCAAAIVRVSRDPVRRVPGRTGASGRNRGAWPPSAA